jgi:hypothetical protein
VKARKQAKGGARKPTARQWWLHLKTTGDYFVDETLGTIHGRKVLRDMKQNDFSPLLGHVVLRMIETKCPDAFVIGFCSVIGGAAVR